MGLPYNGVSFLKGFIKTELPYNGNYFKWGFLKTGLIKMGLL